MLLVPFCEKQLRDIKEKDIIDDYTRICNISTAMNGIDKFQEICEKILGIKTDPRHYITQVYGCTLSCSYCYVTENGIWGKPEYMSPTYMFYELEEHKKLATVFHLMGGAPALYLNEWGEITHWLGRRYKKPVFHSDFLLNEGLYSNNIQNLKDIRIPHLYAVSIKNANFNKLQLVNLETLVTNEIPFYVTYTGDEVTFEKVKNVLQPFLPEQIYNLMYRIPIYNGFKALN